MSFLDVYLDIDGVLLADHRTPALHVKEFLTHILEHFPDSTYWLTTHCKGDAQTVFDHVGHLFDAETVALMRQIKPTNWDTDKTEAINFERTFVWFDDDCFESERMALIEQDALDAWVEVDLKKNPHQLLGFVGNFPLPTNRIARKEGFEKDMLALTSSAYCFTKEEYHDGVAKIYRKWNRKIEDESQ